MKVIEMNIDKIVALCKKYKVAKLWVFGSILTSRSLKNRIDFLLITQINVCLIRSECTFAWNLSAYQDWSLSVSHSLLKGI